MIIKKKMFILFSLALCSYSCGEANKSSKTNVWRELKIGQQFNYFNESDSVDEGEHFSNITENQSSKNIKSLTGSILEQKHQNNRSILHSLENTESNKGITCKLILQSLKIKEITNLGNTRQLISSFKNIIKSQNLKGKTSNNDILLILVCLEYYMNDFRNAREFEKLNGVSEIILPALNFTKPALQAAAAHLLASASLSSSQVQITATRRGLIPILLNAVMNSTDIIFRVRSMNAISCLLKNYPAAQAKFIATGGFSLLAKLLEKEKENHQLMLKVITLLHNLLVEHKIAIKSYPYKNMKFEKIYEAVGFEKALVDDDWCTKIVHLLILPQESSIQIHEENNLTITPKNDAVTLEHNLVEKVCDILQALTRICHHAFNDYNLKTVLIDLKHYYSELSIKRHEHKTIKSTNAISDTSYSRITKILQHLTNNSNKYRRKDEL